jgi:Membrane protein involved in colicin uptake
MESWNRFVEMRMFSNIIAGIVLFFVLKLLFQWLYDLFHVKRIKQANEKVIALLKPYASSEKFPSQGTFYAAMGAVASDYHINYEELNPLIYYFQEFIKEILEDSYIPLDKKVEYTDNIHQQMKVLEEENIDDKFYGFMNQTNVKRNIFSRNNQLNFSSLTSGLLVSATGFVVGSYSLYESLVIFLIVSFVLVIFVEIFFKDKLYKQLPQFFGSLGEKFRSYRKQRAIRKAQEAKEHEQQAIDQEQLQLETQRAELEERKKQLLEEQIKFQKEQEEQREHEVQINQIVQIEQEDEDSLNVEQ